LTGSPVQGIISVNAMALADRIPPVLLLVLAAACTDEGRPAHDAAVDTGDADPDAPDGEQVTSCPVGLTNCGDYCADLFTDHENCGACARACEPSQVCSDGDCLLECPGGLEDCFGGCVDVNIDVRHCGACGHACSEGQECVDGDCEALCPEGSERCVGVCVRLDTDPANCGACGHVCPVAGESPVPSCEGGVCMVTFLDDPFDCAGPDSLDGWTAWNDPPDGTGYEFRCDPVMDAAVIRGDGDIDSLNSGMTRTVDISAWSGGTGLVLSFQWRATSTTDMSTVTNAKLRVSSPASGEELFYDALIGGGILDSGWQPYQVDLSEAAAGSDSMGIIFFLRDAWHLNDFNQTAAWRSVLLRGPAP
jgi:hypothetical protein